MKRRKQAKKGGANDDLFHQRLGVTFRQHESDVADLASMAALTCSAMTGGDEQAAKEFAVYHLIDMVEAYRARWYQDYEAAKKGVAS